MNRMSESSGASSVIALDAMGGEHMPQAAIDGALQAVDEGIEVVLVGDADRLEAELSRRGVSLRVHHAGDVIGMDDHAGDVRRRGDASVMVGMRLVKEAQAGACISLGHSGATMAAAMLHLGRIPGVDRPAILASLPVQDGGFAALLDVGANAECRPNYLQQFAIMGSVYAASFLGRPNPTVGLLSIGEEPHKGTELVREAHALLAATPAIRFHGNIEGKDIIRGTTDVIVTDGFTGNVVLKLAEGEARTIFSWIRDALSSGLRNRLGGLLIRPALREVAKLLDPAEYGAQPLLGVDGYAFIGHGSADARAVASALRTAGKVMRNKVVEKIRSGVASLAAAPPVSS